MDGYFVLYFLIFMLALPSLLSCLGALCTSLFHFVKHHYFTRIIIPRIYFPDMHLSSFLTSRNRRRHRRNSSADILPVISSPWQSPVAVVNGHYLEDNHYMINIWDTRTTDRMLYVPSSSPAMVPEPPNIRDIISAYNITASVYRTDEDGTDIDCAVCLGALETGEMVIRMPLCGHVYHEKCICRWLMQNPSCPLCRSPVRAHLSVTVGD